LLYVLAVAVCGVARGMRRCGALFSHATSIGTSRRRRRAFANQRIRGRRARVLRWR